MNFPFGVDYYPEHWPQERWEVDAQMMQEAGINIVRLAEFAWSYLEPQPGCFDFQWLDRALETLAAHGIKAILGTPTASPTPWVMSMYPDAYRVLESGQRMTYGQRREYCPTHTGYRERGRIITRAMAEHYHDHPAVIGWQIDNEFGDRCYCPACRAAFQAWLRTRYGSLEALNAAWGTIFWSHVYTEWSQIPVPASTGGVHNPGLTLDYYRFMSNQYVDFQREQVTILRQICHKHFITHNFMGFNYDKINYFDLAADVDFVSWDNYPRLAWRPDLQIPPAPLALNHATMRGLKGKNFWLMEEQSGSGGWQTVGMTPRPGEMRLWTYQAVAHGADGMVYFRWRTARFGTEQYWHGILDHHGRPRRRYQEVKQIGEELKRNGEKLSGAESRNQIAMLLSYDTRFAFQVQPNHPNFTYPDLIRGYYAALHRHNVGIDIVRWRGDLSAYRLVIAPALHVLPVEMAARLRRYVEEGGTLVVTARTGVKDESNTIVDLPLPGLLSQVFGVEVDEYDTLPAGNTVGLSSELPNLANKSLQASLWCDVLSPSSAEIIARYQGEYYAGRAAITMNHYGKGKAIYIGTLDSLALPQALSSWFLELSGVQPISNTPEGVEVVERWQGTQRLVFILNHTHQTHEISLPFAGQDLLSGQHISQSASLEAKGVIILAVK